jgi:hypothetical protein
MICPRSHVTLSVATVLVMAAFGCSSAQPDSGLPDAKEPTSPSKSTAPAKNDDTTSETSPTTPSAPASEANACGAKATSQECGDCCIARKPSAWEAADNVYFGCLCAAATCATACADSVCAAAENEKQPSAACGACLDAQGPACDTKAVAACDADADCKAIDACLTTACDPIADKESGAGGGNGSGGARPSAQLSARAASSSYRQR